jgi:hypothetical protein
MSESIDPIEQQLASLPNLPAPEKLRAAVLRGVERQLRAQRWERRLLRIAAAVFVIGFGLNLSVVWHDNQTLPRGTVGKLNSDSLAQIVVAVSDATDAETGGKLARQIAALYGETLSEAQVAELQRQVRTRSVESSALKEG